MTANISTGSNEFRQVMGQFPTGVVIVTATGQDGRPVGMSVGSFTSVSLDPPLVAFFPAVTSRTWPEISVAAKFCVNVLASDQQHLSRAFSRSGGDKFEGVEWRRGETGSPIIAQSLAWIECELDRVDQAGDHYIVVGAVRQMAIERISVPLVFFQGGYGSFAAGVIAAGDRRGDLAAYLRIVDLAREEVEALTERLGAECIVTALAGEEFVILAGAGSLERRSSTTLIGSRISAAPPVGATFMPWEPPDRITAWMASVSSGEGKAELVRRLTSIRARGYAVSVEGGGIGDWGRVVAESRLGDPAEVRSRLPAIIKTYDPPLTPADARRVRTIHMPVFGPDGRVTVALNVGEFDRADAAQLERLIDDVRMTAGRITTLTGGQYPETRDLAAPAHRFS